MELGRTIRHLFTGTSAISTIVSEADKGEVETAMNMRSAIRVRVAIEHALSIPHLRAGTAPRERAIEVFSELGLWCGRQPSVLIYLLLADRSIEIVAGPQLSHIPKEQWAKVSFDLQQAFRARRYRDGLVDAIKHVRSVAGEPR